MLKCSTSLWSADLANLAAEMKRVEPHTERFHIDVADGHYVPTLLFFDQGEAVDEIVGLAAPRTLKARLEQLAAPAPTSRDRFATAS